MRNYNEYLRGEHWRDFRLVVLTKSPWCRICRGMANVVHHLTYERVGGELLSDVVSLCEECHNALHDAHRKHGIPLQRFAQAAKIVRSGGKTKRKRKAKAKGAQPTVPTQPVVIPAVPHELAHLAPQVRKLLTAGYPVTWMSRRYGWDKEQLRSLVAAIKAERTHA